MIDRKSIVLCLLLCLTMCVMAQPRLRTPEMYVGVHGGVLASMVYFSPSVDGINPLTSPLTPNGGVVFRYAGHKVCGLQVELNYMQRGWHEGINSEDAVSEVDYRRKLRYIEIPLLMHLYFGSEHCRGFVNLGPQVGYCFSDVQLGIASTSATAQYAPIQHPFDWGLSGGIGIYYRHLRIGVFQLEMRFNYSLGSIFNTQLGDYFSNANPMDLSLNLAYLWQLRVK